MHSRRTLLALVTAAAILGPAGLAVAAASSSRDSAAGVAAATVPTSQSAGSLTHGGRKRTYQLLRRVTLPTAGTVPLVVVLHGGFGDGAGAIIQGKWQKAVTANGFIVVAPDGVDRAWNAGLCCGSPAKSNIDDVGFIATLVQSLQSSLPIDLNRTFVTGMSNGAFMAYHVACEASSVFAAAAPVAGTLVTTPCQPTRRVSILHIHGLADQNVPFAGGYPTKSAQPNPPSYPPVMNGLATWATINGCGSSSSVTSGKVVTRTWTGCASGIAVRLITISDGGHSWPGGQRMSFILDPPSTALDATATIWAFFVAQTSG